MSSFLFFFFFFGGVFYAGVYGGAGARGAVPTICPEWRSARGSKAPPVQDKGRDTAQYQLQRSVICVYRENICACCGLVYFIMSCFFFQEKVNLTWDGHRFTWPAILDTKM